jgi:hypothetical protein
MNTLSSLEECFYFCTYEVSRHSLRDTYQSLTHSLQTEQAAVKLQAQLAKLKEEKVATAKRLADQVSPEYSLLFSPLLEDE